MAPATQTTPILGRSSVNSRSPQTVRVVGLPATQSAPTGNKSSTTGTSTIRNTHVAGSSTPSKQSVDSLLTRSTTHAAGSSTTVKRSTVGLSTVRNTNVSTPSTQRPSTVRNTNVSSPSTQKPTGVSTIQSVLPGTGVPGSTTTQKTPVFGGQSPGGIHPNLSTLLPPVSQGQHGATTAGGGGTNTAVIAAGVLVPLILIGAGALIFYIWYRRKYPVRMVVGRDFNRFSNPAYNTRASTLTLVRHDAEKEWERIDTLSRKNPELSHVNEDEPDGIVNRAFKSEIEEANGEVIVEKRVETDIENAKTDTDEIPDHEEVSSHAGIIRERPKTKRAVLVKTATVEDLENGFELVTESDLGKRTESEVSSGNESTETHTISLTFSDTFDERHKNEQTSSDDKKHADSNADTNDDGMMTNDNEKDKTCNEVIENVPSISHNTTKRNETVVKEAEFQSNKEPITDNLEQDAIESEMISAESDSDNVTLSADIVSEEINSEEKIDEALGNILVKDTLEDDRNIESDTGDTINQSKYVEPNKLSTNVINNTEEKDSFVILHEIPVEAARDVQDENVDELCTDIHDHSFEIDQKDPNEIDESTSNSLKHDSSFEILADPEGVIMKSTNLVQDTGEGITQDGMNVLERERIETSEKETKTQVEAEKGMLECSSVDIDSSQSILTTDKIDSESTSGHDDTQRKKPSLNLSNENIVLEAVPPTPTVFVQESFILETEATLPVYLDNTNMSPPRGRRAFTLNDIISKQSSGDSRDTHGFSLPKGMEEISKSSPVISEFKSPDFPKLDKIHFDYVSPNKKDKENGKIFSKDDFDQNLSNIESHDNKEFASHKDKNEDKEHISEVQETVNLHAIQNNEPSASSSFNTQENCELENDVYKFTEFQAENIEKFTSVESDSFGFIQDVQDKAINLNREMSEEQAHFNDISTDPFNFISAHVGQDQKLEDAADPLLKTDHEGGELSVDSVYLLSADTTKPKENLEGTRRSLDNGNGHENIVAEENVNDDNQVFNNFPQSSTPTASIIADMPSDTIENSQRKKVLPQTFDFENLSSSDDVDSAKSSSSSESGNDDIDCVHSDETSGKNVRSYSTFESDVLGLQKEAADSIEDERNATFQRENVSAIDSMFGMTRSTDSSTALSWDILSRENSQDSSSFDHFDNTNQGENVPGLLEFSVNHDQNSESNAALTINLEDTSMFDFISEMPKQSASNNTSLGSAGITDTSWEVVNEEKDNSEC